VTRAVEYRGADTVVSNSFANLVLDSSFIHGVLGYP
jgi:hypothetical protein